MIVEQFVMAYGVEQDRIRAMLPEGYESLRPALRINTEIRNEQRAYIEFNTPVAHDGKRGWLNIAHWEGETDGVAFERREDMTVISAPFLLLSYKGVGIGGGCPAEKDNNGCFFPGEEPDFRPNEVTDSNKEFCGCEFVWKFHDGDASGKSIGKTLPAYREDMKTDYPQQPLYEQDGAGVLLDCGDVGVVVEHRAGTGSRKCQ